MRTMTDIPNGTVRIENDNLMVRCSDGWLCAGRFGDPDVYDEICVYLKTDDGRTLTLAIVGKEECDESTARWMRDHIDQSWEPMHVYSYNGVDDDVAHGQYVRVSDEYSNWE